MVVISDTSVISNLYQIGQLSLLEHLFTAVVIPPTVLQELYADPNQADLLDKAPWITVRSPQDQRLIQQLLNELDLGEAEAIVLAIEQKADLLLIDEAKGRAVAEKYTLTITGVLGLLIQGKKTGYLSEVRVHIIALRKLGFRLSLRLVNKVLAKIEEQPIS